MRPSPSLCRRVKTRIGFTTKRAPKNGFYRGTNSGSMGAHTQYGGYIIDYRKTRHFVVPKDLDAFHLTPYVSRTIRLRAEIPKDYNGNDYNPRQIDPMRWLSEWKAANEVELQRQLSREQERVQAEGTQPAA